MVELEITNKSDLNIIGIKTWISGTNNKQFEEFWRKVKNENHFSKLKTYNKVGNNSQTKSTILGLSCTEKDPKVRSFWFFIGVETEHTENKYPYEMYHIKPYKWAIFRNIGNDINALLECEMYAWKEWLNTNGKYEHDFGPEMEVYFQENKIEYWLPIIEKKL
jgi:AraC family transcriptional regulator